MVLKHPKVASRPPTLSVDPLFTTEGVSIPRHRLRSRRWIPTSPTRSSTTS